jgi:hypothetical protein
MSDIEFIDGLNAKAPNQGAPEYVKAKLSIRREALIAFLQQRDSEWINAEIKESKGGNWYVAVDSWKPNSEKSGQSDRPAQRQERQAPADSGFADDSIPF